MMASLKLHGHGAYVHWYAGSPNDRKSKWFGSVSEAHRFRIEIEQKYPRGGVKPYSRVKGML